MERVMENLVSDVNSIRQAGQTPVLPGKAAALLGGYEQMKQLEGVAPETPQAGIDGAYNL